MSAQSITGASGTMGGGRNKTGQQAGVVNLHCPVAESAIIPSARTAIDRSYQPNSAPGHENIGVQPMNVTTITAIIYTIASAVVVLFQIALALGAPWGAYAMGGAFPGRFPPRLRVAAVVQAILLVVFAAVVLSFAGLALPGWTQTASWLIWLVIAFNAIAAVLNTITRSVVERRLWAPVTYVMLACSVLVALTAR
jgi:hypothetical protein